MPSDDTNFDANYQRNYYNEQESRRDLNTEGRLVKMRFAALGVAWMIIFLFSLSSTINIFFAVPVLEETYAIQAQIMEKDPKIPARAKAEVIEMQKAMSGLVVDAMPFLGILSTVMTVIYLIASIQLLRFRGVGMAISAGILGCIPFNPLWIWTCPIAIWTFLTISNEENKQAYHLHRRQLQGEDAVIE